MGAVINQIINNEVQPLGFYSKLLTKSQSNYSTYDRELTGIFQSIKFFKHILEGRHFSIITDHKPITFAIALQQDPEKASPRQRRQLDYIAQFSTDIQHISGTDNAVADWLSRISTMTSHSIDFEAIQVISSLSRKGSFGYQWITPSNLS